MGTRADFYVGRGLEAQWLGSIAWDGYPEGIDAQVLGCGSVEAFRHAVAGFLAGREDKTEPAQGWPWPWETSATTDYAYAFDEWKVWASSFGGAWFDAQAPEADEDDPDLEPKAVFPDMSLGPQREKLGAHSGVILMGIPK